MIKKKKKRHSTAVQQTYAQNHQNPTESVSTQLQHSQSGGPQMELCCVLPETSVWTGILLCLQEKVIVCQFLSSILNRLQDLQRFSLQTNFFPSDLCMVFPEAILPHFKISFQELKQEQEVKYWAKKFNKVWNKPWRSWNLWESLTASIS